MRQRHRVAAAMMLLMLMVTLASCGHPTPASIQKPPSYPSAVGWTERSLTSNDNLLNIYRAGSFTTSDSPEAVLAFYKDALVKDNWLLDAFQPDPNALVFRWSSYEDPPAQYLFEVRTKPASAGNTLVEVEQRFNPGS